MQNEEILATVEASQARRLLGLASLWGLSCLILYLALTQPIAIWWQILVLAIGACGVWLAESMRRATSLRIELTASEVRDSSGRILVQIDNIKSIDRGMLAFKPSNGFLLTCKTSAPRVWAPGIWWRIGRIVGVGGITPGSQTKFMAEMISAMIAQRDA